MLTHQVAERLEQEENYDSDVDRQLKNVRAANERLKKKLEVSQQQFQQFQNEMFSQMDAMKILQTETENLRIKEIENRSESSRLKADLHEARIRNEKLEREIAEHKFKSGEHHQTAIRNLRELVELKEQELVALKEKFEHSQKAHQRQLEETIRSHQFSVDNAKRLGRTDSFQEEQRRQIEEKIEQFCKITKPLLLHRSSLPSSLKTSIDFDRLDNLIRQIEAEKRVASSLSPLRNCLSILEAQMKDLHNNIIENHARRSKRWKYKLSFECLACESRWEVTHDIRDLQEACLDPTRFIESSRVDPMPSCSCPTTIDFVESDVRLCLDDLLGDLN